jgi:hypothetical protein
MSSGTGIAILDFGTGANEASIAVIDQASILASSKAEAWIMGDDSTSDHGASDHRYFNAFAGLTCGTPTAGVGFTIYANSMHKISGTYQVRYVWAD